MNQPAAGCVDSHHHIWRQQDLPWLLGPMQPRIFGPYEPIRRDYTIAEYLADVAAAGVTRSVYVQTNWAKERFLDEVRYVSDAARETSWPHAIVAQHPMCDRNWSNWRRSRWCAGSGCSCTGTTIRNIALRRPRIWRAIRRCGAISRD